MSGDREMVFEQAVCVENDPTDSCESPLPIQARFSEEACQHDKIQEMSGDREEIGESPLPIPAQCVDTCNDCPNTDRYASLLDFGCGCRTHSMLS